MGEKDPTAAAFVPRLVGKYLPTWDIKPLPEPRIWSLRALGPGLLIAALGVGLGETFMWPRLVMLFGPEIRWYATVGIIIQTFILMEMCRWAIATGESIFTGAYRIHPLYGWSYFFMSAFLYVFPGHVVLGAKILEILFGMPTGSYLGIGAGLLVLMLIILLLPRIIFDWVKKILTAAIALMMAGGAIIAALIGTGWEWLVTGYGMFAFGWSHPGLLTAKWFPIFVGSIAFIGPSGLQQCFNTVWLREDKVGMGYYSEPIVGLIRGRALMKPVPPLGATFNVESEEEMKKWRGWLKWSRTDAWVTFFLATLISTYVFTVIALAGSRLYPPALDAIKAGKTYVAIVGMSKAFETFVGPAGYAILMLFFGLVSYKMTFGLVDAFARCQTDMIYAFVARARKIHPTYWYYGFLIFVVLFGLLNIFTVGPAGPELILDLYAFFAAFSMGYYCITLLILNRFCLPKKLRSNWLSTIVILGGAIFYLSALFYSLIVFKAIPKG